jgi:putative redox protein
MEYNFKGKDLKEDKVKRAIDLSLEKFCSVKAMLEKTAEITYSFTINNS